MASFDSNIPPSSPLDLPDNIPQWVSLLAMPVWIVSQEGNIVYLNPQAEALMGKSHSECVGQPCHETVNGVSFDGEKLCGADCLVRRSIRREQPIEPIAFTITGNNGNEHHVKVVIIAAEMGPQRDQQLVHCIVDEGREHAMRRYVETVRSRSKHRKAELESLEPFHLSDREKEILRLLATDETLHGIAHKLSLSYATVRNHVQHLLTKLGVHSILEAVAVYLLAEDK